MFRKNSKNFCPLIVIFLFFFACSLFSEEILVFYHIPKCGGTTVASLIGEQFSTEQIFKEIIPEEQDLGLGGLGPLSVKGVHLLPIDKIDLKTIKYIHGHISYSSEKDLVEAKNITFLRDPVERIFSAYRFVSPMLKLSFFDHYEQSSNLQVMRLSALSKNDPTIILREHLESAKKVLSEKFFFVGIVEEMEESLHTLYKLLDWQPISQIPVFNTTKKTEPIDPDLYSYVYKEEWADRELYAFAKQLFQNYKKKAKDRVISKKIEYVNNIHFTAQNALDGQGWGYRELDLQTNTFLRQSYIKNAFIRFPLLKNNYVMKVKAYFPPWATEKKFLILINGQEIDYTQISEGSWRTFTALIPKKSITKKKTKITFYISDLYIPSEHANVDDDRRFGIGISKIDIEPLSFLSDEENPSELFR